MLRYVIACEQWKACRDLATRSVNGGHKDQEHKMLPHLLL
jgi:hypothetical protein